jgi:hypothetical protein
VSKEAFTNTMLTIQNYAHRLLHLLIVTQCARTTRVQAFTNGKILFYTFDGFADLRECAQCPLEPDFALCTDSVPAVIGCSTSKCLCGSHLEEAISVYGQSVLELCNSNTDDEKTATSFLKSYCAEETPPPTTTTTTTTTTTGASTVTVTAVIEVTVMTSGSPIQPPPLRLLYTITILVVIGLASGI